MELWACCALGQEQGLKARSSAPGIKKLKILHTKQRTGSRSFCHHSSPRWKKRRWETVTKQRTGSRSFCHPLLSQMKKKGGEKLLLRNAVQVYISYSLIPGPRICDNPLLPGGELSAIYKTYFWNRDQVSWEEVSANHWPIRGEEREEKGKKSERD